MWYLLYDMRSFNTSTEKHDEIMNALEVELIKKYEEDLELIKEIQTWGGKKMQPLTLF